MSDGEPVRSAVDEPRRDGVREWEVFVRPEPTDVLRHAGSVSAPTAETAHEHAGALFGGVETLWLCPTDEVVRFSTRTLGDRPDSNDTARPGDHAEADA